MVILKRMDGEGRRFKQTKCAVTASNKVDSKCGRVRQLKNAFVEWRNESE